MKREFKQTQALRYSDQEGLNDLAKEGDLRLGGYGQNLRYALLLDGLVIFREIRHDPIVQKFQELLTSLSLEPANPIEIYQKYHDFCAAATEVHWPEYLWELVLEADNVFSKQARTKTWEQLDSALRELAVHDLKALRVLASLDSTELHRLTRDRMEEQTLLRTKTDFDAFPRPEDWPKWAVLHEESALDLSRAGLFLRQTRNEAKTALRVGDEEKAVCELARFYRAIGVAAMATALAFKWDGKVKSLMGVISDPIRKEQLIGQNREQGIILENTKFFLAGYPANNVILYGNRGTGKSSLVKALLQEFCDQGLRLVELAKRDLNDLPEIIRLLAAHPQKFILFIDDLSFDESELEYKALKTLLEGGLEKRPANVLIYATSNRRHLIRENFSERQGDEVHVHDNMDEKLSLADRFGITVTFPSPNQEEYLKIVEELARQEGLALEAAPLRQQALRWVMMHNARSGRTARQFIDYMMAQQQSTEN